jgi:L-fuconolactonase
MLTEADWQHWKPEHMAPYLDVAFKCFGPERLMIGSDWPVCSVAAHYSRAMSVVKDYLARCSAVEQEAVLGANAQRFSRLRPPQSPLQSL